MKLKNLYFIGIFVLFGCAETKTSSVVVDNKIEGVEIDLVENPTLLIGTKFLTVNSGENGAIISGLLVDDDTTGKTTAAHIELVNDNEFSNQKVKVSLVLKSISGNKVKVAYSTNDVGNSGWFHFEISDKPLIYSFEYKVPKMVNGNNDYIGIAPLNGSIEVRAVVIERLAEIKQP